MTPTRNMRFICIGLLPFVLCISFAPLDAHVLCTADGHGGAVEPAHLARTVCVPESSHGCCHTGGMHEEIRHDHVTCNDVPLRLNQVDIQGRRLQVVLEAGASEVEVPGTVPHKAAVCMPGHGSSRQHLKSVVLLI